MMNVFKITEFLKEIVVFGLKQHIGQILQGNHQINSGLSSNNLIKHIITVFKYTVTAQNHFEF